jgi:RND family efflux transporter MFP subunit
MAESAYEQPNPSDTRRLKATAQKVLIVLVIVAILIAIIGVASRLISRSHLKKRTADDAQMTVVTTKPDSSGADNELVLPGNVSAFMEAPIYARTNGYLKVWYTDIGARVHKGQLLAEIETPEVDRQLAQARADLDTAIANSHLALTTNARWQTLAGKQAVSRQDADEKAGDAAAKVASEASARQNVKRLEDLESFKRVLSPFDGVVTARNTDVGALINAGETSGAELFRVADIRTLRVFAQVPEPYAVATRAGLNAELHFAEHPGDAYPAKTVRTSHALDPAARTLQVELELDNRDGQFFPGAYTEVHFKLPSDKKTLRLPSNTVLFRDTGIQVATVDQSHKIRLKTIGEGRDFGKTIEVLNGLDPNDDVVVNPSDSIEDGMPVRIAPPKQNKDDGQSGGREKQGGDQDKQGDKDKQDDKDKKATGEAGDSKTKTAESSL